MSGCGMPWHKTALPLLRCDDIEGDCLLAGLKRNDYISKIENN